jgi:hypothetical protein
MQREIRKTGLQKWEAGSLKPLEESCMNTALRSLKGHCSSPLPLVSSLNFKMNQGTNCQHISNLHILFDSESLTLFSLLQRENLSSIFFLNTGICDSANRNSESELLEPFLLEEKHPPYFGVYDNLTLGLD